MDIGKLDELDAKISSMLEENRAVNEQETGVQAGESNEASAKPLASIPLADPDRWIEL